MADQPRQILEPYDRAADRAQSRMLLLIWLVSVLLVAVVAVLMTRHFADRGTRTPLASTDASHTDASSDSASAGAKPGPSANGARTATPSSKAPTPPAPAQDKSSAKADALPSATPENAQITADDDSDAGSGESAGAGYDDVMRLATAEGLVPLPAVLASAPPSNVVGGWCKQLANRFAGISAKDCMNGAYRDSGQRSVEGRPLVMRHIPASSQPSMGRVLLISATHGDEPSSIATVFRWVQMMTHGGTPYDWKVLPTLNPDGVFHQPSTRVNANGVDLNRNLPTTGWAKESRAYWRRVGFEKRRFPGESAGSEPENRWLAKEIHDFAPDVIITLHAPYGVLDYDGNFPPPRQLGHLDLHRLGVYPGSLGNFAARMQGIPVITIELEEARRPPGAAEVKRMWADLNGWLDRYLRSVRQAQASAPNGAG